MVKETRIFFEVGDVLQLRIVCGHQRGKVKCDGERLYQLGENKLAMDWRCPRCGESWVYEVPQGMNPALAQQQQPEHERASRALIAAIESLVKMQETPFAIRFEFEGEDE